MIFGLSCRSQSRQVQPKGLTVKNTIRVESWNASRSVIRYMEGSCNLEININKKFQYFTTVTIIVRDRFFYVTAPRIEIDNTILFKPWYQSWYQSRLPANKTFHFKKIPGPIHETEAGIILPPSYSLNSRSPFLEQPTIPQSAWFFLVS